MNYPRILSALRAAKWAALPSTIQAVHDALSAHMRGAAPRADLIPTPPGPPSSPNPEDGEEDSGVCVIQIYGIIGKNLSMFESMCGGVDVNSIEDEIEAAMQDPDCTCILLDIDSPGGVVSGVPELAATIAIANKIKPIYAFTGAQCCSAAYWIASQCEAIACTVSADVGSVGVYMALCDDSEWWSKNGYKLELIKAGQFKATGISGQPLSAEARALLQADVDAIYEMFTKDVRLGRGDIPDSVMQGQTFMGQASVDNGMCDEIVSGIDDMISDLSAEHAPQTITYG
jgi:signal peptide peptidase SppA